MFELFLRSGAFTEKCLGRVCFKYCAWALSEKTQRKVQSDYLNYFAFHMFRADAYWQTIHGICERKFAEQAEKNPQVSRAGVFVIFFYNCFVFHILLESKDLREKKGNTKHSGYKSKEKQTTARALTHFKLLLFRITGTWSSGNREKFIDELSRRLFWFILDLNKRPFGHLTI